MIIIAITATRIFLNGRFFNALGINSLHLTYAKLGYKATQYNGAIKQSPATHPQVVINSSLFCKPQYGML